MSKARKKTPRVQNYPVAPTKPPRSMPPRESDLWPKYCRGALWDWSIACFFVGRCQLCAYACPPSERRQRLDKLRNMNTYLLCTNHPDSPGYLCDMLPTETCRNFKAARWRRPPSGPKRKGGGTVRPASRGKVRRIPLGHNLFATVDAADFKWLSQYKWCASNTRGTIYAVRRTKEGRTVCMHREIMKAPKGMVVDHIDHNTLNNRRCNLWICTAEQNYANAGPRGSASGYVGVTPHGNKWVAYIVCRGVFYYLGSYGDPVEAAKVRDRKAYELHGERAYLNFPEDFRRRARRNRGLRATPD